MEVSCAGARKGKHPTTMATFVRMTNTKVAKYMAHGMGPLIDYSLSSMYYQSMGHNMIIDYV